MNFLKKLFSLVLALCMAVSIFPQTVRASEEAAADYVWITDREAVDGSDYTADPTLADALNGIFDGNASVYRDSGFM